MQVRRILAVGVASATLMMTPACQGLVPSALLSPVPSSTVLPSPGSTAASPTPLGQPSGAPTATPAATSSALPIPTATPPYTERYPDGIFSTGIKVRLGAGEDAPYHDGVTAIELGVAPGSGSTGLRPHMVRLVPEVRLNDNAIDSRARFTVEVDEDVELDEIEPGLFAADDETGTARIIVESLDGRMRVTIPVTILDEAAMDVVVE
ncbi:MAG: hypothetical protein VKO64_12045 [Candidatus Sericytochromatia bacterium]|nr:hypothetical protein [Candidatus Sericytochromatia bacterium]